VVEEKNYNFVNDNSNYTYISNLSRLFSSQKTIIETVVKLMFLNATLPERFDDQHSKIQV